MLYGPTSPITVAQTSDSGKVTSEQFYSQSRSYLNELRI